MKKLFIAVILSSVPVLAQSRLDILNESSGAKTFNTNAVEIRKTNLSDGGTVLDSVCYRTVKLTLKDAGTTTYDLGGSDCVLSAADKTAAVKLMDDSSTTAK